MAQRPEADWVPLDEAAKLTGRSLQRIKSHMRNGRLQRGVHFRRTDAGLELNIYQYRLWLDEQNERRRLPLVERVIAGIEDEEKRIAAAIDSARPLPHATVQSAALRPKKPKLIPL